MQGERRVAAIPETVKKLVAGGAKVLVKKGAGTGSFFPDEEYAKAGAVLVDDVEGRASRHYPQGEGASV